MQNNVSTIQKWLVFLGCGLMIMLINLDLTIVNIGLANMAQQLNIAMSGISWVVIIYLLSGITGFPVFGKLADSIGRKNVFLYGVSIFALGSLIAGITNQFSILLFARSLQGLGFASAFCVALIISIHHFPEDEKAKATGLLIVFSGAAQAIGPTLGGYILSIASWHWLFLINLPLCFFAWILCYRFVYIDIAEKKPFTLNSSNMLLFSLSCCLLILGITMLNHLALRYSLSLLLSGLLLLIAFVKHSHRCQQPVLNIDLLKNHRYLKIIGLRFIYLLIFSSWLFIIPLFLQNLLGFSALKAGNLLLAMTVLIAIASILAGHLLARFQYKTLLIACLGLSLASILSALRFNQDTNALNMIPTFVCFGIGAGIFIPTSIEAMRREVKGTALGSATGLFLTCSFLGSAVGVGITASMVSFFSWQHFMHLLKSSHLKLSLLPLQALKQPLSMAHPARHILAMNVIQHSKLYQFARISVTHGFHGVIGLFAILTIVAMAIALCL